MKKSYLIIGYGVRNDGEKSIPYSVGCEICEGIKKNGDYFGFAKTSRDSLVYFDTVYNIGQIVQAEMRVL